MAGGPHHTALTTSLDAEVARRLRGDRRHRARHDRRRDDAARRSSASSAGTRPTTSSTAARSGCRISARPSPPSPRPPARSGGFDRSTPEASPSMAASGPIACVTNRERTIPAGHAQLERVGTLQNFELAAKSARAGYRALGIMFDRPFPFLDTDVYKWLEARRLGARARARPCGSGAMADEAIALVEAAQRPDGYLNTFVQVLDPGTRVPRPRLGPRAVLHRAPDPGGDRLAPRRSATIGSCESRCAPSTRSTAALGPGRPRGDRRPPRDRDGARGAVPGHRRSTPPRARRAACIERRGHGLARAGPVWAVRTGRTTLPVREAAEVDRPRGAPAVPRLPARSTSPSSPATQSLLDAVHRRWQDMIATSKMYLTGALGSRHKDEAFGDPFELPPDRAYAETCAAIASRHARLAAPARDRRPALRRRHRADRSYNGVLRGALARRHRVLLRQSAPAPDAPCVVRGARRARAGRARRVVPVCMLPAEPDALPRARGRSYLATADDDGRAAAPVRSGRDRRAATCASR